jgi:hypothetical protein
MKKQIVGLLVGLTVACSSAFGNALTEPTEENALQLLSMNEYLVGCSVLGAAAIGVAQNAYRQDTTPNDVDEFRQTMMAYVNDKVAPPETLELAVTLSAFRYLMSDRALALKVLEAMEGVSSKGLAMYKANSVTNAACASGYGLEMREVTDGIMAEFRKYY